MQLNEESLPLLVTEISIMKSSSHPNIVQYYGSYNVEDQLWVVMEIMNGGCLTEVLEQFSTVQMTEIQIAYVCREVLNLYFFKFSKVLINDSILVDNKCIDLYSQPPSYPQRY